MATLRRLLNTYLAEILLIIGVFFIVFTTFEINTIAGLYILGGFCIVGGLVFAKRR